MAADRVRSRERYGFAVVEDASHAIGGDLPRAPGRRLRCADITVFSFHPVKIVTTGEGGMVTTHDPALARRLALLRTPRHHARRRRRWTGPAEGPWYYQQVALGFNYRHDRHPGRAGRVARCARIEECVARRTRSPTATTGAARPAAQLPGSIPDSRSAPGTSTSSARRRAAARRAARAGLRRPARRRHRRERALHPGPPAALLPRARLPPGDFPEAEAYYGGAISLPMSRR